MAVIKFGTVLIFHNYQNDERMVVMEVDKDFIKVYNINSERNDLLELSELKPYIENKEIEIVNY